jgi:hypothetical protein
VSEFKKFGPKLPDSPSVGKKCLLCEKPYVAGDYTTLVSTGPDPADPDAVRDYLLGRAYNSRAVEIHWHCRALMGGG